VNFGQKWKWKIIGFELSGGLEIENGHFMKTAQLCDRIGLVSGVIDSDD
jgi:hypothetical protein